MGFEHGYELIESRHVRRRAAWHEGAGQGEQNHRLAREHLIAAYIHPFMIVSGTKNNAGDSLAFSGSYDINPLSITTKCLIK